MIYTLSDLRSQVLRHLDEDGDTGTTYTLATNLLNQANQRRAMMFPHRFLLWDLPVTFTTTVGDQIYPLHTEFARPVYFRNVTTNTWLKEVTNREIGPEGYDWNNSAGPAEHFMLWGTTQVKNQPSSQSVITIVSNDAADVSVSDDSPLNIFISGETADGEMAKEVVRPNGTTGVETINSYTYIRQVSRAGAWTGVMTMTSNEGTVTNLTLDSCELGKLYHQLYLVEEPTTSETIEYRFYKNPIRMTNDYDQPDIPFPFSQLLVWDALILMAGYNPEINPLSVSVWRQMQAQMEDDFQRAMQEGQTIESRNRRVRYSGVEQVTRVSV